MNVKEIWEFLYIVGYAVEHQVKILQFSWIVYNLPELFFETRGLQKFTCFTKIK
jgi:hypothetical protein